MKKILNFAALSVALFFLGIIFVGGGANSTLLPSTVYVDDDYDYGMGDCGSHTCGVDGFNSIYDAVNSVAADGTVNIAPGTYENIATTTIASALQIIGPGQESPATVVSDCGTIFDIRSSGALIDGLKLMQTDGGNATSTSCYSVPVINIGIESGDPISQVTISDNEISGGASGIYLGWNTAENTVSGNEITDNDYGIAIYGSTGNDIAENTISESEDAGIILAEDETVGELGDPDVSGNTISSNEISASGKGIYYTAGDQANMVNIGDQESSAGSNYIHDNSVGISINGNSHNLYVTRNRIVNNDAGGEPFGMAVLNDMTGVDATLNWWGGDGGEEEVTDSGPYEAVGNPQGQGNSIAIDDGVSLLERTSQFINYRPFCLDESCSELSSLEVSPDDLTDLFYDGGSITVPELGEEGYNDVTQLNVQEDIIIAVPVTDTENTSVTLPAGTVITRTNDGSFDATLLSAAETELNALSGFGSGTLVGAFQWGIPSLGLEFDPAITINMFVGTDLADTTLVLQRSLSTDGGWTDEGLWGIGDAEDGTCIVDDEGFCEFEATLASYYGALEEDEEDNNGSSHSGDWAVPRPRVIAQANTANSVNSGSGIAVCPGNFSRTLNLGMAGEDVRELQRYLNSHGYPVALTGVGSAGNETNYFGALTAQAVSAFQKGRGLGQTGSFDAATMTNLGCGVVAVQTQTVTGVVASVKFNRDLELGAEGEDVRELQKYLNANGFIVAASGIGSVGNETVYFGELTKQSLIKFQQAHNLPAYGYFGPMTRAAMGI